MVKDKKEFVGSDIGGIVLIGEDGKEKKFPFELPEFESMPEELYSNHVIINHTNTEYNLFFTRINPVISKSHIPKGRSAKLDVVARIVLPPQVIEGLISALEKNYKDYKVNK